MASRPDTGREGLRPLPRYQRRRLRAWGRGERRKAAAIAEVALSPVLRRALLRLDRPALARTIDGLIDHLNALDGDADREPDDFSEDDDPLEVDAGEQPEADQPMWQQPPRLFSAI